MSREVHVRFWESAAVKSRRATHLPLYRQERIDARGGVWIGRQARCRYVEAAAHLLITIRAQLIERILRSNYVQVDETFTKLIDPDRRGRSRDAYLWGYHAPLEKVVVFEFSPTRSGTILYDFFPEKWCGVVQTDGAAMYPSVFRHRPNITHIECIAHLRRYVLDALKSDERQAVPLYKDISELYRLERVAKDRGLTDEQRGYFRHAKAKPVLKRLQAQFRELEHTAPPTGNLRDAVTYAKNRWQHLSGYAKAGFGHISKACDMCSYQQGFVMRRIARINGKNTRLCGKLLRIICGMFSEIHHLRSCPCMFQNHLTITSFG